MTHTTPSTMLAVAINHFGGPEVLQVQEVPVPDLGPRDVLIRIEVAGVGEWDPFEREGGYAEMLGYDWSEEVAAITSPTMLVFADADSVRPEHIVAFYKALGGGERDAGLDGALRPAAHLAIVPGMTHYNILSTTIVAELVAPFLDASMPAAEDE